MTLTASARRAQSDGWLEDPGFGVYVHIPFCRHRCHYCDFNTYEGQDRLFAPYVAALERAIYRSPPHTGAGLARRDRGAAATSVFFGGGTPTLLGPRLLSRLLHAVRSHVGLAAGAEITVEANPETVEETDFEALLEAGFNRSSIGVQSLAPSVLEGLGRTHSAGRALDAVAAARRAGVTNINMDLIYGSPWESADDLRHTLEATLAAAPDHVSAYALTVESGTPLDTLVATERVPDVDGDVQADRFELASMMLEAGGFERYETSNWARRGRACRHNLLYWSAGDYLGFGAGAHAHSTGRRSWNVKLPRDFIDAVDHGRTTEAGFEQLDRATRASEAMMLGLRLRSGVAVEGFKRRFGAAYLVRRAGIIAELEAKGLIESSAGFLSIPNEASLMADEVIRRLA